MDRSWMHLRNKLCKEYLDGIKSFMKAAEQCANENNLVHCPCKECQNAFFKSLHIVKAHLKRYGIAASYTKWVFHGEEPEFVDNSQMNVGSMPSNKSAFTFDNEEDDAEMYNLIHDMWEPMSMDAVTSETNIEENVDMIHDDNREFRMCARLLEKAGKSLFPGSKLSALSFIVKLMHIKVLNKLSNKAIDMILQLLKEAFPEGTTLPSTTYDAKKMLKYLGLGYEVIHACKYDCALFWKEYGTLEKCPYCGEPRYKFEGSKKKVPLKVLRYFPLKPRLQRLFISRHTARDMRWHQEKRVVKEGILRHPADGEAWKEFDRLYPWFVQEPRNVRMGLATDGFNPFGNMHNSYSMWPIILVPYNLPPWKCMKDPFMMMSLLIPRPKAPGRDIDVYIRPLIDELKELWNHGVETFDASTRQTFHMHAAVMWTINDFPAYGNLSGWSTKGYKACPVCNVETSSRKLNSKICYMGHR
ncbi:hypothetical protein KPL70_021335 [Citrus sinensis]|uniref:uncharacterized protein LOC102626844 isoform X2 n=1 Tax=Citrus sinensis TaxID=2711 RepID=UPI00219BF074|nr:uncharacterized protein LOC102626844 isoform X2 [Citrus sinensis]KAH9668232.1 hypothetical protein KPL70_021335 [Citrus sinensis]